MERDEFIAVLETLPKRKLAGFLAECIKHAYENSPEKVSEAYQRVAIGVYARVVILGEVKIGTFSGSLREKIQQDIDEINKLGLKVT